MTIAPPASTPPTLTAPKATHRPRTAPPWLGLIGYAIVALEIVLFAVLSPNFLTVGNLVTVLTQATIYAIAAFGLTIVVIVGGDDVIRGGIDLSVGATLGLGGALVAILLRSETPLLIAIAVGLAVTTAVGVINGLVVVAGIRPLLATLAMAAVVSSLTIVLTGNVKVPVSDPGITELRAGHVLGLPASIWVLLAVYALLMLLMTRTRFGTRAYAVGQQPLAARIAGVPVARYIVTSYALAGLLAGGAGVLMTSRLSAALPGIGEQVLIDILLATFLSIAFSRRLVVTITGTMFSAIFVAVLTNGFTQLGVQSQWIGVAKGVLILVVLAVAAIRERGVRR